EYIHPRLKEGQPIPLNKKFPDRMIPETPLWKEYIIRYEKVIPDYVRNISLSILRDFIYIFYDRHECSRKAKRNKEKILTLKEIFYSTLDELFVLPNVVRKVTFEILSSIDKYKTKYADVLH